MTRPDCPSEATLQKLITGKLDNPDAEAALSHIANCPTCEERMESVASAGDSFVGHEVEAAGRHLPGTPEFEKATRKIRQLQDTSSAALADLVPEPAARYARSVVHASGGVGNVWRAADTALGREVALKELRIDQGNSARTVHRFLNEARVTGQLAHPGIVPVYDVGFAEGKPFYTMKFVQGKTLHEAVGEFERERRRGSVNMLVLRRLINVVIDVANAIAYAHSRGVLHRDLKGKNIVLGDFGEVLVLDWGLARLINAQESDTDPHETVSMSASGSTTETEDGSVVGTPSFMSPEQAMGKRSELNERTDVYGLGAVLYQVLTGEPPYGSGDSSDVLGRAIQGVMPRPRDHWSGVPRPLEAICEKALSREQSDRYESATALAADLERWLADEPIVALRESPVRRMFRWARRHQTLVAATSVLAMMTILALGTTALLVSREQSRTAKAQVRAEANFNRANETVSSLLGQIGDLQVEVIPELARLREAMLSEAIAFNQEFLKVSSVPEVRYEAAKAHSRIARLQFQLGKMEESAQSSEEAIEILRDLEENKHQLPGLKFYLGCELSSLGHTLDSFGRRAEAVVASENGIGALRESEPGVVSVDDHRREIAEALIAYSQLCDDVGEREKTNDLLAEASAVLDEVSEAQSESVDTLCARASLQRQLALYFKPTDRVADALVASLEACSLLEKASRAEPESVLVLYDLNHALNLHATLLHLTGKQTESAEHYARAIAVNEQLVERSPFAVTYQESLINGYTGLGITLSNLGQRDAAREQFEKALERADSLARRFPGTTRFRHLAAKAKKSVGVWYFNCRKVDRSLGYLQDAIDEFETLSKELPDVLTYKYETAVATGVLALAHSGHPEHKDKRFDTLARATQILESLCEQNPDVVDYRHKLGISYRNTGRFYQAANQQELARKFFQKAIDSHRRTVEISADKPRHERQLAIALFMLGRYCWQLEKEELHDEAERNMFAALEIRERILDAAPEWTYATMDVVLSHLDIGQLMIDMKRLDDAARHLRTGADICKDVVDEGTQGAAALREYGECFRQLALVRLHQQRPADALKNADLAIAAFRSAREERPDRYEYHSLLRQALVNRAAALSGLERVDDAVAAIDEMLTIEPLEDFEDHHEAAQVLARCSVVLENDSGEGADEERQTKLRSRAIEQLKIAIEKGLPQSKLVNDAKLKPLAMVPEFQALLPESK